MYKANQSAGFVGCRAWGYLLFLHYVTGPEFITWKHDRRLTPWFVFCCCPLCCCIYLLVCWSVCLFVCLCVSICPRLSVPLSINLSIYLFSYLSMNSLVKSDMTSFDSHRCLHHKSNRPFSGGYSKHSIIFDIAMLLRIDAVCCLASDRLATVVAFCINY